jgi:hypothetical protein
MHSEISVLFGTLFSVLKRTFIPRVKIGIAKDFGYSDTRAGIRPIFVA